ncbi:MAG: hypothetical protein PVH00_12630 [Gemmatimonadota bacterium]|jgi:uncharacterized membrane protein
MDVLLICARVLHVFLGVFWAGTLIFIATFMGPSVRDAGPDGAKVMAGLMRRRFLDIMPAAAVLTVLSGLYLYWRVSGGFEPEWMGSAAGMTYGIGAVAALIALGLGLGILRPAMLKAAALGQSVAGAPPEERDRALAAAQALRARAGAVGQVIAVLLAIAVITMAIARYV